jgi:hypothetical protein
MRRLERCAQRPGVGQPVFEVQGPRQAPGLAVVDADRAGAGAQRDLPFVLAGRGGGARERQRHRERKQDGRRGSHPGGIYKKTSTVTAFDPAMVVC